MTHLNLTEQKGFANTLTLGVILLLAISLPIATKLVQQNQENRSNAASNGSSCSAIKGTCLDRNTKVCTGNKQWYKGKCPGAANIQCCAPKNATTNNNSSIKQDTRCSNAGGKCKKTSDGCPNGNFLSGYCPSSGSGIKCCVKSESSNSSNTTIKQDTKCTGAGGTCKKTSDGCPNGNFLSGYCPSSGSDVKCCTPKSAVTSIIQDSSCTKIGGRCENYSTDSCSQGRNYKEGLCPSSGSGVKCCIYTNAPSSTQTSGCTKIGGKCMTGMSSNCVYVNDHLCSGNDFCCMEWKSDKYPIPTDPNLGVSDGEDACYTENATNCGVFGNSRLHNTIYICKKTSKGFRWSKVKNCDDENKSCNDDTGDARCVQ